MHRFTWCNERVLNVRNRQEDGWLISDGRAASRFADVPWRLVGRNCVSAWGTTLLLRVDTRDFTLVQSGSG